MSEADRRRYLENKESENARSREYYRKNRKDQISKAIARNVVRNYGITVEQRDEMAAYQEGLCAICKNPRKLHIDHDHATGVVRALLCSSCNKGLGMFYDNPDLLLEAASYIARYRAP